MSDVETNDIRCKYCGSCGISKYGKYKDTQLYWCKICKRKFKADDTMFYMQTPSNEVSSALNMHYDGMSIKAIRRYLKQEYDYAPSIATIFEWIQKYTQFIKDSIKAFNPSKIGNTWVADETVLRIDNQNVWLWDIIDTKPSKGD